MLSAPGGGGGLGWAELGWAFILKALRLGPMNVFSVAEQSGVVSSGNYSADYIIICEICLRKR